MVSYLYNAPAGIAGDISRPDETNVEPIFFGANTPPAYGGPYKFDSSGNPIAIAASDAATVFKGLLVRPVPAQAKDGSNDDGPDTNQVQNGEVRGYVYAPCTIGTPVRGGIVYMRVVAASGKLVGDLEATADGSNNVVLVDVTWAANGKDTANGNIAEVRIGR